MRRRRPGHAIPGADAGCAALVGRAQNPSAGFDEQPENTTRLSARESRSSTGSGFPNRLIPADARVEMDAKKAAGYFTEEVPPDAQRLATTQGRTLWTLAHVAETPVATLRSPKTIRERCRNILNAVASGRSAHFRVDRKRLNVAAGRVEAATRRRYPDLDIPYHSRWRHFETGGRRSQGRARSRNEGRDAGACARARIDLAVVSVLLDGRRGSGMALRRTRDRLALHAFGRSRCCKLPRVHGRRLSARRDDPLRADAAVLSRIDAAALARLFQVDASNPIVGLEGRAALLRRLGDALVAREEVFDDLARPGGLFETLIPDDETKSPPWICSTHCRMGSRRSGRLATPLRAYRLAMSGVIRTPVEPIAPPDGCRSTNYRNGSRIRCSSRSSGPA